MALDFDADDTIRDLERSLTLDTRRALLAGLTILVNASPVGEPLLWKNKQAAESAVRRGYVGGHFRRNWQVGVGLEPLNEIDGGEGSGKTEVIAAGGIVIRQAKFGRRAFIVNNAPYANRIAEGHSRQPPAGWIDAAVEAMAGQFTGTREV